MDLRRAMRPLVAAALLSTTPLPPLAAAGPAAAPARPESATAMDAPGISPDQEWTAFGGSLAAQHFSTRTQITRSNVASLQPVWSFRTHVFDTPGILNERSGFEANPVLWNGKLFLDTPFDTVFALDAHTGAKMWSYDPQVAHKGQYSIVASRGVALWHAASAAGASGSCGTDRVFVATLDRRLISMDASSGQLCDDFGHNGTVDLRKNLRMKDSTWLEYTSPPTVIGDIVVLGSSIGDNQEIEEPSGAIRGFDARTGAQVWSFEPLPWAESHPPSSGSGGVWSLISADPALGLVYLPTGSPSLDFYGNNRPGDDRDANSIVAVDAKTGRKVWAFQTVHHDLWDYDNASEPLLFTFRGKTPALAITTKTGQVFVLDRRTGEPLYPVVEKPVPQSTMPGERTSPTQPFSSLPTLIPLALTADNVGGTTEEDKQFCRTKLATLNNQGIFTPVSMQPTLLYPGSVGGANWGSPGIDDSTGVMYVNVNSVPFVTRFVERDPHPFRHRIKSLFNRFLDAIREFFVSLFSHASKADVVAKQKLRAPDSAGLEVSTNKGAPYMIYREAFVTPSGVPCAPPPYGQLVAMDLNKGVKVWSKPLGTIEPGKQTGQVVSGGPLVTAGGLVITAGTSEPLIRAFDKQTGELLWEGKLPAPANAVPMTYELDGVQYLVICAGGHGALGTGLGDYVVAFALSPASSSKR